MSLWYGNILSNIESSGRAKSDNCLHLVWNVSNSRNFLFFFIQKISIFIIERAGKLRMLESRKTKFLYDWIGIRKIFLQTFYGERIRKCSKRADASVHASKFIFIVNVWNGQRSAREYSERLSL